MKPPFTLDKDTFVHAVKENSSLKKITLSLFNPFESRRYTNDVLMDLSSAQKITLTPSVPNPRLHPLTLEYNPLNKGKVFKKVLDKKTGNIVKKPITAVILKSVDDSWRTTYHFMTKDLKDEIGYVMIGDINKLKKSKPDDFLYYYKNDSMMKDYPKLGISGDRITIEYLQNADEEVYSGIGHLADKISIEYCLKEGIKPNIVSNADTNSHIAHFKRGKRFLPVEDYSEAKEYFQNRYGTANVNEIVKDILKTNKDNKADISEWGRVSTYMPQELIEKYLKEIKKSPSLH